MVTMARSLRESRCSIAQVVMVVLVVVLFLSGLASATPFSYIQLGDNDGFGFTIRKNPSNNDSQGLIGLTGTQFPSIQDAGNVRLDANNNRKLDYGEYLPDLDNGGTVASGGWDGFNFRTAAEAGGQFVLGAGFVLDNSGLPTTGSQWTDISITNTYYTQAPGPNFNTYQPPPLNSSTNDFPDANAATPNKAFFRFAFLVNKGDIDPTQPLYLNVKFADYEVVPAKLDLVGPGGALPSGLIPLAVQSKDGLIQLGHTDAIPFGSVFTDNGSTWKGFLEVTFDAPNEPFYAVDFVQLGGTPLPEPATMAVLAVGGLLLAIKRRRA